jgi:hypothetical protein
VSLCLVGHVSRELRGVPLALCLAAAAYAAVSLWTFPRWTVDDAYIVCRYARNLVEHGRLAWNPSGDPVEGYTGIALPLLVAAGMRLGADPVRVAPLLGAAAVFAGAWSVLDNQRQLGVPSLTRAYVTAIAFCFAPLYAHATSGLETVVFAALLGWSYGALLRCLDTPRAGAQAVLWTQLLALSLVRPEGVLCAAIFGGALATRLRRSRAAWPRAAAIATTVYAVPYGAYFVWRALYYGRLLPNTYYAKALDAGVRSDFVVGCGQLFEIFLPLIAVAAAAIALGRRRARVPRLALAAATAIFALATVQYSRSILIMGYLYRFQVHFFFLLLPVIGACLPHGRDDFPAAVGPVKRTLLSALTVAMLAVLPAELVAGAAEVRWEAQRYLDVETAEHASVGAWVRDHLPTSESVACWIDAGLIPYIASEHWFIDFGRLNDATLARPGLSPKQVADYFFGLRPGALVLTSDGAEQLAPEHGGATITGDARFVDYRKVASYCSAQYPTAPCEILFLRNGVTAR